MNQLPGLYIADINNKGRGVFTSGEIQKDDVIEICPVIVISQTELPIIHKTVLHDYYFLWGPDMNDCAIALGFGSLYNHEVHSNANFILDFENNTIDIIAITDIKPGEEITLNYHGEPGDDAPLWF
ncbi:MAG: SET domain-containing protein-lysine N-methyltransferase [Saprospiraceae bacterium]